ncbi:hypothetical protein NI18_00785 [Sphingomonas sp. Ant20]|nr:hypothetical protein NI18_00785 [Sphingomonas sp. Ant20]
MTATVAVLGANLCGWIAAAALARRLPRESYRVVVIDDGTGGDGLGDFAPVIAVPPALAGFHADLGLDAATLVRMTGGGHALGVAFGGWRADGAATFLSYGETGAPLEASRFTNSPDGCARRGTRSGWPIMRCPRSPRRRAGSRPGRRSRMRCICPSRPMKRCCARRRCERGPNAPPRTSSMPRSQRTALSRG